MSGRNSIQSGFLLSALTVENPLFNLEDAHRWRRDLEDSTAFKVERIPFNRLEKWSFDPSTGDLAHDSGKFFRVEGLRVSFPSSPVPAWEQPIIVQPEIGILGILTRVFEGVRYFLMQAKMEPGNFLPVQIAPTVQATRSNFTQVHQGNLPLFLDHFLDPAPERVLVDQLHSEQGARFFRKRNRNLILEIDEDIPIPPNFCWLTLGQIKHLLRSPDIVNMDARSVISCIPFCNSNVEIAPDSLDAHEGALSDFGRDLLDSLGAGDRSLHSQEHILSWFTARKNLCDLQTEYRPLNALENWTLTDDEIRHVTGDFFSVIAVRVDVEGREVAHWTQPLIAHPHTGLIGFLAQKKDGALHFLVRAHSEPGTFDRAEMSPTVICSNPRRSFEDSAAVPFLNRFLEASPGVIHYDVVQSEEGGRFFQVRNRNMILEVPESEEIAVPDDFIWMTLDQIAAFTRNHSCFNMEARSLLACMGFL